MTTNTVNENKWHDRTWIIALLVIFFFPVGLYGLWKSKKYQIGWKIAGTVYAILIIMAGLSDDTTPSTNQEAIVSKEEKKQAPLVAATRNSKYLFEKPEDFRTQFNSYSSGVDLGLEVDELKVENGPVKNTFNVQLTEKIGIIGAVEKETGSVDDVMMIASIEGEPISNCNVLVCSQALIASVDPSLDTKARMAILSDLGLLGESGFDLSNHERKIVRGMYKYFVAVNPITGYMLSISPHGKE